MIRWKFVGEGSRSNWKTTAPWLVCFILFMEVPHAGFCHSSEPKTDEPNKSDLVGTLKSVFPLLEKKDHGAASKFFVLPPNFKPEMLDGLIDKREISEEGIRLLEQDAEFGSATKMFGEDRAKHFAARASVEIEKCFGFNHETKMATAEVIALWDGSTFKLIRLDDVGKLEAPDKPAAKPEIDNQKIAEALPVLEAAVKENPDDVSARAKFAMALFKVGNLPSAMSQLLQARKLQPDHNGINRGITVVFGAFEKRGLFAVGVPMETIKDLMGEPEKNIELTGRTRWAYAFMGVDFKKGRVHEFVDLRGATEALYRPTEIVSIELDGRGWQCGIRKKVHDVSSALYYLPGENITNWTEQIEIERRLNAAAGTIKEIGQQYVKQVLKQYPDAFNRELKSDADSVILAFVLPPISDGESRHQLVRLMKGPVDLHRIAYSIKGEAPSKELQSKWLGIFQAAKLDKTGKPNGGG